MPWKQMHGHLRPRTNASERLRTNARDGQRSQVGRVRQKFVAWLTSSWRMRWKRRPRPLAGTHCLPMCKCVVGRTLPATVRFRKGHSVLRTSARRRMSYARSEAPPVRQWMPQTLVEPALRQVGARHRRNRRRQPGGLEGPQHHPGRHCRHLRQQRQSARGQNVQTAWQEPLLAPAVASQLQAAPRETGRTSATAAQSRLRLGLRLRLQLRLLLLLLQCLVLERCRPCPRSPVLAATRDLQDVSPPTTPRVHTAQPSPVSPVHFERLSLPPDVCVFMAAPWQQ